MNEQIYAVRTREDIETFLEASNGLRDGYVTSVHYDNENAYVLPGDGSAECAPFDGELRICAFSAGA